MCIPIQAKIFRGIPAIKEYVPRILPNYYLQLREPLHTTEPGECKRTDCLRHRRSQDFQLGGKLKLKKSYPAAGTDPERFGAVCKFELGSVLTRYTGVRRLDSE